MTSDDHEAFQCDIEPDYRPTRGKPPRGPAPSRPPVPVALCNLAGLPICRGGVYGPSGNRMAVMEARRLLKKYEMWGEVIGSDWANAKEFGGMQSVGRILAFGRDSDHLNDPINAYECSWCRKFV